MVQLLLNASWRSHLDGSSVNHQPPHFCLKPWEEIWEQFHLLFIIQQILKENTENILHFKGFYSVENQPAQMCANKMLIINNLRHNVWFHFNTEKADAFLKWQQKFLICIYFKFWKQIHLRGACCSREETSLTDFMHMQAAALLAAKLKREKTKMTWVFSPPLNLFSRPVTHEWGQRERKQREDRESERKKE